MGRHHFLRPDGRVISSMEDPSDYALMQFGGYTEVQVVPIDAVVIEGPLPETEFAGGAFVRAGSSSFMRNEDPARIESLVREYLAIAAYLREHPPIDEAQVKALAEDLRDIANPDREVVALDRDVARSLIELGWTKDGAR